MVLEHGNRQTIKKLPYSMVSTTYSRGYGINSLQSPAILNGDIIYSPAEYPTGNGIVK
jgi:hypothetical protein